MLQFSVLFIQLYIIYLYVGCEYHRLFNALFVNTIALT